MYVGQIGIAVFANTKSKRSDFNEQFVPVDDPVFLVSTKSIGAGREVFAFYKRLDKCLCTLQFVGGWRQISCEKAYVSQRRGGGGGPLACPLLRQRAGAGGASG